MQTTIPISSEHFNFVQVGMVGGKEITAEGFNSMNSVVKGFHLFSHSSRASRTAAAEASVMDMSRLTTGYDSHSLNEVAKKVAKVTVK
jgi:hypothetical protein